MSGFSGSGQNYGSTGQAYHDNPHQSRPYTDTPRGARAAGGYQDSSYSNYQEVCDKISSDIFKINTNATTLERSLKQLGSKQDSRQLRERLHNTEQSTNRVISDTTAAFKYLNSLSKSVAKTQRIQFERLKNEFQTTVQRYSLLQKSVAERVRAIPGFPKAVQQSPDSDLIGWGDDNNDEQRLIEEDQRRQQLQQQEYIVEGDLQIIQEREESIRQLESDIIDINEIFKDLATLVNEQGEQIDSIEANVEQAHDQVEAGRDELQKAAMYQRKARKKICCIVVVLTIIVAIVVIIIVVAVKK